LGVAWKLQYATEVRRVTLADTAKLVYIDFDGRQLQFPILNVGQEHFHPIEKYTLARLEDEGAQARYAVRFPSGIVETYAMHPQDTERWLLQRYETRDKQWLTFDYTPTGAFREVSNNCHSVSCRHDDHGRITEVHLIDEHGEPTSRRANQRAGASLEGALERAARWKNTGSNGRTSCLHNATLSARCRTRCVHTSVLTEDLANRVGRNGS
jgi:type VI secretion system secreted protein VgrG